MKNDQSKRYRINELAAQMSVTPRTIRYYVSEGLLPPPEGSGQNRVYTDDHALRLEAIKHLKEAYLPLHEIRSRLSGISGDDLVRLATTEVPSPRGGTALQYISALLGNSKVDTHERDTVAAPAVTTQSAPAEQLQREVWTRVEIAPGVELNYRTPTDSGTAQDIERLLQMARNLFSHGSGNTR